MFGSFHSLNLKTGYDACIEINMNDNAENLENLLCAVDQHQPVDVRSLTQVYKCALLLPSSPGAEFPLSIYQTGG